MINYLIHGVDCDGSRTQVAHTSSARAAKAFRDKANGQWEKILVFDANDELSVADLDRLSETEDRQAKRY